MLRQRAAAVLLLAALGCASVQPLWQPERFIAERTPDVVYVTTREQHVTAVARPRVVGDTLFGVADGHREVAIALHDVGVAARRTHVGRTVLLAVGAASFSAMIAVAVFGSGTPSNWYCDYSPDIREQNGGAPLCYYR